MEPSKKLKQAVIDYKNGKDKAFTTVYEESQKYIYVCISKIMKDCDNLSEVVNDLMQDTYVEVSRHISQLENVDSFLNWAGTIATRQCYAYLKNNKQYTLLSEGDDTLEELVADEELIPETLMQNREKQRLVRRIIDEELTPMQRLCVIAYYYNEQKQSEIAHDLGIPENTVKTHLSRAKAKIKEGILELEKKEGTKLYSVAPFLLLLLEEEIRKCVVPSEITKVILAAGKGGAGVAAKGGITIAVKVKIAAAVIGVGTLAAVGGGIFLSRNRPPEMPEEVQKESVEGKKDEKFMGYQFQYPESAELQLNGNGYFFKHHENIAILVHAPVDTYLFSQNFTDLEEAPPACEQYIYEELETSVSEIFDPDTTTQTITASEHRTVNGIEMLRVEGFFTNIQQGQDIAFVGYYFFTEITPVFQTFSTPYYVIGISLNDEADVASFLDEFAEGITKSSEE